MYQTLLIGIIPLILVIYLIQHSRSEKIKQKEFVALRSYINKLADFEVSETIVGKTTSGLFKNAFLYSHQTGEIMIVTKNEADQFIHEDYHINDLIQSEIRVNRLVVSSIQQSSMSTSRLKDLEVTLNRDMGSRNNVKRMIIHLEFKTNDTFETYEIPCINGFKPIQKEKYNQLKREALKWQHIYGKHCVHMDTVDDTPVQLTIESIQDPFLIEDTLKYV